MSKVDVAVNTFATIALLGLASIPMVVYINTAYIWVSLSAFVIGLIAMVITMIWTF